MAFLSASAPFLAAYWPVLVSVILIALTAALFVPSLFGKKTSAEKGQSEGSPQEKENKRSKVGISCSPVSFQLCIQLSRVYRSHGSNEMMMITIGCVWSVITSGNPSPPNLYKLFFQVPHVLRTLGQLPHAALDTQCNSL